MEAVAPDVAMALMFPTAAFTAKTRYEYVAPFVRPTTTVEATAGVSTVVHVVPLVDCCTTYPVTAEPPELVGADHDNTTSVSPARATTLRGDPGVVKGVVVATVDAAPEPTELFARTRYEYVVPLVRPVNVVDGVAVVAAVVQETPPSVLCSTT